MSTLSQRLRRAAEDAMWPAPKHVSDTLYWHAADELDRLTARVEELETELKARNKSARDRLHSICMALEEDKDKSPFSREAWDELQAENDELRMRVAALKNELDSAVRTTAIRCREMALWPQSIDDEQAYYGRMFAEFIDREFRLSAALENKHV